MFGYRVISTSFGVVYMNILKKFITSTAFSKVVEMTKTLRFLIPVDNHYAQILFIMYFTLIFRLAGRNPGKNHVSSVSYMHSMYKYYYYRQTIFTQ
jgi:hypothetical protein